MSISDLVSLLYSGILLIITFLIAIFFYLYRLERIPGLGLSQAFGFFLFSRLADGGSFWWAQKVQGWKNIQMGEINLVFRFLDNFLPPAAAFFLSGALVLGLFTLVFCYLRISLREDGWSSIADRITLAILATATSLSLFGAATNIAFGIFGRGSPL